MENIVLKQFSGVLGFFDFVLCVCVCVLGFSGIWVFWGMECGFFWGGGFFLKLEYVCLLINSVESD